MCVESCEDGRVEEKLSREVSLLEHGHQSQNENEDAVLLLCHELVDQCLEDVALDDVLDAKDKFS